MRPADLALRIRGKVSKNVRPCGAVPPDSGSTGQRSGEEVRMLWGKLNPGPHHVGFKSVWELDTSRPYNMIFEDKTAYASEKSPRPILINIWYPAKRLNETRPMRHRDYLAIETEDPLLARFAAELVEFERSTACREMMGKSAADLSDAEQKLLDEFWATPTASLGERATG